MAPGWREMEGVWWGTRCGGGPSRQTTIYDRMEFLKVWRIVFVTRESTYFLCRNVCLFDLSAPKRNKQHTKKKTQNWIKQMSEVSIFGHKSCEWKGASNISETLTDFIEILLIVFGICSPYSFDGGTPPSRLLFFSVRAIVASIQ